MTISKKMSVAPIYLRVVRCCVIGVGAGRA